MLSLPLIRAHSPLMVAAYTMVFGGLAAVPFALPGLSSADWGPWASGRRGRWHTRGSLLVAAFGFAAWQVGISRTGPTGYLSISTS
jgi:hypothetical protein